MKPTFTTHFHKCKRIHISLCKEWFLFTSEAINNSAFNDLTTNSQTIKRCANITTARLQSDSISLKGKLVLLTFRGTLVLVIPHHQQFGQAGHLGDFCDDPEKTLDAVVGQHHCREAGRPWRDQRQEEGAVYAGPLLRETGGSEKKANLFRLRT